MGFKNLSICASLITIGFFFESNKIVYHKEYLSDEIQA